MKHKKLAKIAAPMIAVLFAIAFAAPASAGIPITLDGQGFYEDGSPAYFDSLRIINTNTSEEWNQSSTPKVNLATSDYWLALDYTDDISDGHVLRYIATIGTLTNDSLKTYTGSDLGQTYDIIFPPAGQPDLIPTAVWDNPGKGGYLFANETNDIMVNINNSGSAGAGSFDVTLEIDDHIETKNVGSLATGANTNVTFTDYVPTTPGDKTVNITVDKENVVAESDDTNNLLSTSRTVYNNGYKGKRWTGGADIVTVETHDIKGNVIYSTGDSAYTGGNWTSIDASWSYEDLPIPSDANVLSAKLYVYYNWNRTYDYQLWGDNTDFNGITYPKSGASHYSDVKGWGSAGYSGAADKDYGTLVYNVTSNFNKSGNTVSLGDGSARNVAVDGMILQVVYSDTTEPQRMIWINEGYDMLYAMAKYGTDTTETIAYAPFTGGPAIDLAKVASARLIAVGPGAGGGSVGNTSNVIFNNNSHWDVLPPFEVPTQIGIADIDVTSELGTSNEAAIQDNGDSSGMRAATTILAVEVSETQIRGTKFNDSNSNGIQDGGEHGIENVTICIWQEPPCKTTDASGSYNFYVPAGTYTVYENVPSGYTATTPTWATVTVNQNEVKTVNFGNRPIIPPPDDITVPGSSDSNGDGVPEVGRGNAVTIRKDLTAIGDAVSVHLTLNWSGTTMVANMAEIGTTNVWEATFSPPFPAGTAQMRFDVDVAPTGVSGLDVIEIGDIIFRDPSGQILDACTNAPISGATTTLFVEDPPGSGTFIMSPTLMYPPIQMPDVNPLITGPDGMYSWMTVPGKYRVMAERLGYMTANSSDVDIPPPVTDLNINLTRTTGCGENNIGMGGPYDTEVGRHIMVPIKVNQFTKFYGTVEMNFLYDSTYFDVVAVHGNLDSTVTAHQDYPSTGILDISALNTAGIKGEIVLATVELNVVGGNDISSQLDLTIDLLEDIYGTTMYAYTVPATVNIRNPGVNLKVDSATSTPESLLGKNLSAILNENGRARHTGDSETEITAVVTDAGLGINSVTVDLSAIGGSSATVMEGPYPATGTYKVKTNATAGINGTYPFVVTAKDNGGNTDTRATNNLTIYRRGDVVRNNIVNMGDALYIARYTVGLETPSTDHFNFVGDLMPASDGDYTVNMGDALYIARHSVNLEPAP